MIYTNFNVSQSKIALRIWNDMREDFYGEGFDEMWTLTYSRVTRKWYLIFTEDIGYKAHATEQFGEIVGTIELPY